MCCSNEVSLFSSLLLDGLHLTVGCALECFLGWRAFWALVFANIWMSRNCCFTPLGVFWIQIEPVSDFLTVIIVSQQALQGECVRLKRKRKREREEETKEGKKTKQNIQMAAGGKGRREGHRRRRFADGMLPCGFQTLVKGISSIWVYNRAAPIRLDALTFSCQPRITKSASSTQTSLNEFGLKHRPLHSAGPFYWMMFSHCFHYWNHLSAVTDLL